MKNFEIILQKKLEKPISNNRSLKAIQPILGLLSWLLWLPFGFVIMLFASLLSLWQKIIMTIKDEKQIVKSSVADESVKWAIMTGNEKLKLEKRIAGSLPWDSGDYLFLRSNPEIPQLKEKFFGDWFYLGFGGVFLQKWDDIRNINCDLLFIDFETKEIITLLENIPTRFWSAKIKKQNEIEFEFSSEMECNVYRLKL